MTIAINFHSHISTNLNFAVLKFRHTIKKKTNEKNLHGNIKKMANRISCAKLSGQRMLKQGYDIKSLISIIEMDKRIKFAYLFGSVARKEDNRLSDIDIAVYLSDDCESVLAKFDIIEKMMDVLGDDCLDLVIINTAPLPLAARIVSCREILVDREPFLRHGYESLILREYFDFSRLENAILNRRYALG